MTNGAIGRREAPVHYATGPASAATPRAEARNRFGGNRRYTVSDPYGQRWTFTQQLPDAT